MSRSAEISIQNQTGNALTFLRDDVQHGQFDGPGPPASIADGATVSFKVKSDFGQAGPQGWAAYGFTPPGGAEITLTFSWNHPESASTSSYEMWSDPPWYGSYYVEPSPPGGADQKVTIISRLNPQGFDPRSWMSLMGSGAVLRDLFLPGTHDSGSYNIGVLSEITLDYQSGWVVLASYVDLAQGWARSQSGSVLDQLNAGIRYLDLRLSNGYFVSPIVPGLPIIMIQPDQPLPPDLPNVAVATPRICHSLASIDPEVVLSDIQTFLDDNPSEILLVNFEHFYNMGPDDYGKLINDIFTAFGSKLVPRSQAANIPTLTLGHLYAQGQQIILFFGADHVVTTSGHPDADFTPFEQRYPGLYNETPWIWSEEQFLNRPWAQATTLEDLQAELASYVGNQALDKTKFFVLQGVISPDNTMYENSIKGKYPDNLRQLGEKVSPSVLSWVNNLWSGSGTGINVIELDWAEASLVTQYCVTFDRGNR
jgi:hypothetical protein